MKKEYTLSKLKKAESPFKDKVLKKGVGINLSHEVIDYFKKLSIETEIPYQSLINLYLLDCARNKKKLKLNWG